MYKLKPEFLPVPLTLLQDHFDSSVESLLMYIKTGCPLGSFLEAIVCNDLVEAFGCADDKNVHLIGQYVQWLYDHAPAGCWGSVERYNRWRLHVQKEHKQVSRGAY